MVFWNVLGDDLVEYDLEPCGESALLEIGIEGLLDVSRFEVPLVFLGRGLLCRHLVLKEFIIGPKMG